MGKWFENFWYHHKWKTIIAVFVLVVIIFGITSVLGKESYDGNIMIVGNQYITKVMIEDIKNSFGKITDEKSKLNFGQLYYDPSQGDNFQANEMARETLATMAIQSYYIYIMSEQVYDLYKDSGVFENLSNIFEKIPDSAIDQYAIRLSETKFGKTNPGIDSLSEDMVIVLKVIPYTRTASAKKQEKKLYDFHKEIMINLVNYN